MQIDPVTGLPVDDNTSVGEERARAYDLSGLAAIYGVSDRPAASVTPVAAPADSSSSAPAPAEGLQLSGFNPGGELAPGAADRLSGSFGFGTSRTAFNEEKAKQVDAYTAQAGNRFSAPLLKQSADQANQETALANDSADALGSARGALGQAQQGEFSGLDLDGDGTIDLEGAQQVQERLRPGVEDAQQGLMRAHAAAAQQKHQARAKVEAATAEYRAMLASFDTTLNFSRGQEVGVGVALFFDGFLKARYGVDMDVRGTIREYTDRFIQQQRQRLEGQQQVTALEQWQYQVTSEMAQDEVEHAQLQQVFALEQLDYGLKLNALAWGGRKAAAETEVARAEVQVMRNEKVAQIAQAYGERTFRIQSEAAAVAARNAQIAIQREQLNFEKQRYNDQQNEKALAALLGPNLKALNDPEGRTALLVAPGASGEKPEKYAERAEELTKKYDAYLAKANRADQAIKELMESGNQRFKDLNAYKNWANRFLGAVGGEEQNPAVNAALQELVSAEAYEKSGKALTKQEFAFKLTEILGNQFGEFGGGQKPEVALANWQLRQARDFALAHTNQFYDPTAKTTLSRDAIVDRLTLANAKSILSTAEKPDTDLTTAGRNFVNRGETSEKQQWGQNLNKADDAAIVRTQELLGSGAKALTSGQDGKDLTPWSKDLVFLAGRAVFGGRDGEAPSPAEFESLSGKEMSDQQREAYDLVRSVVTVATIAKDPLERAQAQGKLAELVRAVDPTSARPLVTFMGKIEPPRISLPQPQVTAPAPGPASEPQPDEDLQLGAAGNPYRNTDSPMRRMLRK